MEGVIKKREVCFYFRVYWAKDNKRVKWVGYVYNQVFGFGFK